MTMTFTIIGYDANGLVRAEDGDEVHYLQPDSPVVMDYLDAGNSIGEIVSAPNAAWFSSAIQAHLDAAARQRRYDSIASAISYRDDPNPQFAAEAAALFAWRSAVWTYATAELDRVMAGQRSIPTVEEFIAELPDIVWP